ncbi:MAG TPA: hypothetical protein VF797_05770 [Noviherbaspirillum sp.]
MADKDPGRRTFESLTRANLSVRFTPRIIMQPSPGSRLATEISPPSDPAPLNTDVSKPTLRTVVNACPPVSMKVLLGPHQANVRIFQSPAWLLEEQRNLNGKNGKDPDGKKLVAAAHSLLDLCRFIEILLNKIYWETSALANDKAFQNNEINRETSVSADDKAARKLEKKLNAIWSELYLAVEYLKADCKRSRAFVRVAAVEVLDLGVELEDGRSYAEVWAQKLVSRLEILSAGIADAHELLPRTLTRSNDRSKSIKNVLSPNASLLKRSEGEKRVGIFNESSDATTELAREIKVICEAVNELIHKLSESDQYSTEIIGMFKLCAARLKGVLSSSYSLKRWELELHRAHYFFRQAARPLSTMPEMANQSTPISPGSRPYGRMADYIADRFEDTMGLVLKKADPGYARHNFISRKQSGPIPSARVLRSPVSTPVQKTTLVGYKATQPSLTSSPKQQGKEIKRQTTTPPISLAAVTSPLSINAVSVGHAEPRVQSKTGKDKPADMDAKPGSVRQNVVKSENAPAPRRTNVRAATMSVQWQELQALSQQQRSDKKTA